MKSVFGGLWPTSPPCGAGSLSRYSARRSSGVKECKTLRARLVEATSTEVTELRKEYARLEEIVAETILEKRLLRESVMGSDSPGNEACEWALRRKRAETAALGSPMKTMVKPYEAAPSQAAICRTRPTFLSLPM